LSGQSRQETLVHMNFYAASVALLWTTAMQLGAPDAGAPRSVRTAARRGEPRLHAATAPGEGFERQQESGCAHRHQTQQ
jgi:hypothetical protein